MTRQHAFGIALLMFACGLVAGLRAAPVGGGGAGDARRLGQLPAVAASAAGAPAASAALTGRYQPDGSGRYVAVGVLIYDTHTGAEFPVYYASVLPDPTPEAGLTPTPPAPGGKACTLGVQGHSQAVRADHTLASALVRWELTSARLAVRSLYIYEDVVDEWAEVAGGWMQVGANSVLGVDDTEELCWDVPKVYHSSPPPTPVTPTPGPSATPLPTVTPAACRITADGVINVRPLPSTAQARVGQMQPGDSTVPDATWTGNGYKWYRISYQGKAAWAADYFTESGSCAGLPVVNPFEAAFRVGFKATPGASVDVLSDFARRLPAGVGAVAFVVQDTDLATKLHGAGIYTVFVPWSLFPGDCADTGLGAAASVADRLRYVEQRVGAARWDAVVLTNECAWPSAAYYRDWLIAAAQACTARGWTCIPHVHNPGTPPLEWLPTLAPALCALERGGHYWGANIYPYDPVSLSARTPLTQYTTWRHELIQSYPGCHPRWAVTELAPDGGGWPPDVGDTAGFIRATWGKFALIGVWYYGGGQPLPAWPDANWTSAQAAALAGGLS